MSVLRTNKIGNRLSNTSGLKPNELLSLLKRFSLKEDGAMTLFAVFMFIMMLLVAGIGVDLMRNEMERTRLQNTVDRAVLAAADLDQKLIPSEVVADYFDKAGVRQTLGAVTVSQGLNFRTISVTADATSPTQFMSFLGVDELTSPIRTAAEERISNVEISMVLDISGSMRSNNKMANLRTAAKTFVTQVIRPETQDLVSVSLVPYTAQTNAGLQIFENLNIQQQHNFSYCVEFESSDFNSTAIDLNAPLEQMQHFEKSNSYYGRSAPIQNPGCPQRSYEEIVPLSQNVTELTTTIDNYTARANTAINLGMKWGVALLDPSFRPITNTLSQSGGPIDPVFASRPESYSDEETLKTVILMTDGQNVDTWRIRPWYYDSPSDRAHWHYNTLDRFLNRYVRFSQYNNWRYVRYTSSQADTMLGNICDAAKEAGIVIWSVGFEVSDYSANIMRSCASTESHFFRVEGVEISEAFSAIASQINQLRLTQ